MKNILVLEDEELIQDMIKEVLNHNGYNVILADNGQDAIDAFENNDVQVLILDIMVPKIDGFSVCRAIRKKSDAYIVILSARVSEEDKLLAYELGADDYITKPFSPKVLAARINNLFLRLDHKKSVRSTIRRGRIVLDSRAVTAEIDGKSIELRKKAFDLLWLLMVNENIVLTREEILDKVWGYDYFGDTRAVDGVVKSLRKHMSKDYIKTVVGVGYKFCVKEDDHDSNQ